MRKLSSFVSNRVKLLPFRLFNLSKRFELGADLLRLYVDNQSRVQLVFGIIECAKLECLSVLLFRQTLVLLVPTKESTTFGQLPLSFSGNVSCRKTLRDREVE